ncbi:MAG: radical SAM protein [Bacillota bacterium]
MNPENKAPAYLLMSADERRDRVERFKNILKRCIFCPRRCLADRAAGKTGRCGAPRDVVVDGAGPHFGEESVLVGREGSGTIFFVYCNLACVFCQNWTISRGVQRGELWSMEDLARAMLKLQEQGCHNINLVSPTPYLYQITAALDLAAERGLRLPVVYNSSGYESVDILRLLCGFVDIYLPDAKYTSNRAGEKYSGVKGYFSRLKESLIEMQRQVGDLVVDDSGVARRGLLVRHLVMPGGIAGTEELARFLKEEVSARCAVNVMAQYYPAYRAAVFSELNRRVTAAEYRSAREAVRRAGLRLID